MLERLQKAIREERLDGWLFCNFKHRDPLSDSILSVPSSSINTRPWFYLVPPQDTPTRIVHAIEAGILDHLPGDKQVYSSRAELEAALEAHSGITVAGQYSEELPVVSYLDHGTALLLQHAGFRLVSSSALIQRMWGLLDESQVESHEAAAAHLYQIVDRVWRRIGDEMTAGRVSESQVVGWIESELADRGLKTDHSPIVAAGEHSADPHYDSVAHDGVLNKGDVLQLDLWAKHDGGVYADISWVGVLAPGATSEQRALFAAVAEARDRACSFLAERLQEGVPVTGREIDLEVRSLIEARGYASGLRHRTGHAIDVECHGSGVNLDSVEFPDDRKILEGSCFSVEPGLYLDRFGMRTEIDVYVSGERPVVSGGRPQAELLVLKD